ncbi:hypothetical protein AcW1_001697 [Taiwanofungus camphoratus]|nr:hypothetical protein AcW1_001697 [Antrodia cinnamomea]
MPPRVVNPAPDAHTPVGRPPFLPPHPVVRPAGSAATVRCCFGAVPCGKEFRTTASAIKRHLKKYHFGGDECWQDKARAQCAWLCGTEECSLEMDCGSLGSHIASVHLRSTRRMCRYCMRSFSRSDSLARHLPKCRARRSDGDVEIRAM